MSFDYTIDENGVHIGSRTYIGKATEVDFTDVGRQYYDCKIYHYPGGKFQMVKASQNVFRIPIKNALPQKQKKQ